MDPAGESKIPSYVFLQKMNHITSLHRGDTKAPKKSRSDRTGRFESDARLNGIPDLSGYS